MPKSVYICFYSFRVFCCYCKVSFICGVFLSDRNILNWNTILLAELSGEAFVLLVNTFTVMLLYWDFTYWNSHFFTKTRFSHLTTFEMKVTELVGVVVIFATCIWVIACFEFLAGHQLSWLRFSWIFSAPLGKFLDSILIKPQPLPSKLFRIHHSYIILPFKAL
jgi:hypothetical protein